MDYNSLAEELLNAKNSRPKIRFDRTLSHLLNGEIVILYYLEKHGGKAYPKELSDELVVSTARVAVLLNTLEKDGLITRKHDNPDSRHTTVMLSDKGRQFILLRRQELLTYFSNVLENLGEADAVEYVRLQKKFISAMKDEK